LISLLARHNQAEVVSLKLIDKLSDDIQRRLRIVAQNILVNGGPDTRHQRLSGHRVVVRGAAQQAAGAFVKQLFELVCSLTQGGSIKPPAMFMLSRRAGHLGAGTNGWMSHGISGCRRQFILPGNFDTRWSVG
jgi:hypothetical protein